MASNGSALVSADIPIDSTPVDYSIPVDATSTGIDVGVGALSTGVDTTIDSSGDEGYVDSAGALGGGNSVSSNNPNASDPAPGSPVGSWSGIMAGLEDLTKVAIAGAQVANTIEGAPNRACQTGGYLVPCKYGQSAPVRGSRPSWLAQLLGTSSGRTSGVNQASASGVTGLITLAFIGVVILGLGFLVYKAVR